MVRVVASLFALLVLLALGSCCLLMPPTYSFKAAPRIPFPRDCLCSLRLLALLYVSQPCIRKKYDWWPLPLRLLSAGPARPLNSARRKGERRASPRVMTGLLACLLACFGLVFGLLISLSLSSASSRRVFLASLSSHRGSLWWSRRKRGRGCTHAHVHMPCILLPTAAPCLLAALGFGRCTTTCQVGDSATTNSKCI